MNIKVQNLDYTFLKPLEALNSLQPVESRMISDFLRGGQRRGGEMQLLPQHRATGQGQEGCEEDFCITCTGEEEAEGSGSW